MAFNNNPIFGSDSEIYLNLCEKQVAALGMEIMLRFCFLDPIVVNQPASLEPQAYFLLILEFNFLQVHGHLPF
jgi:hypothetical protein